MAPPGVQPRARVPQPRPPERAPHALPSPSPAAIPNPQPHPLDRNELTEGISSRRASARAPAKCPIPRGGQHPRLQGRPPERRG